MSIEHDLAALEPLAPMLLKMDFEWNTWKFLLSCYDHEMFLGHMIYKAMDWLTAWCKKGGETAQYRLEIDERGVDITVWNAKGRYVVAINGRSLAHVLAAAIEELTKGTDA